MITPEQERDALKLALENQLRLNGAGSSEFTRSQPSDACEIMNLRYQVEMLDTELERSYDDLATAQARVAEWGQRLSNETLARAVAESALKSARRLLELCKSGIAFPELRERVDAWLREHPE